MTPHVNPRGHVALLVGDLLILPTGRPVPFAEVTGWEEADDDAVPTPACLAAAESAQRVIDARPVVTVARVLPVLDAPKPWAPDPEVTSFLARCAEVRAGVEERLTDGPGRAAYLQILDGQADAARRGIVPSKKMWNAVDGIADGWSQRVLHELAVQAETVACWAEGSAHRDAPFLSRVAGGMLGRVRRGYVAESARKAWAGYWNRYVCATKAAR